MSATVNASSQDIGHKRNSQCTASSRANYFECWHSSHCNAISCTSLMLFLYTKSTCHMTLKSHSIKKYNFTFWKEITANGRNFILPLLYFAEGINQLILSPKFSKKNTVKQYKERGAPLNINRSHSWIDKVYIEREREIVTYRHNVLQNGSNIYHKVQCGSRQQCHEGVTLQKGYG